MNRPLPSHELMYISCVGVGGTAHPLCWAPDRAGVVVAHVIPERAAFLISPPGRTAAGQTVTVWLRESGAFHGRALVLLCVE